MEFINELLTETKTSKIGVDIGNGFKVHRVGYDSNGNWSYSVSHMGKRAKNVQHVGNLTGEEKVTDIRDFNFKDDALKLAKEIKTYYKKYLMKNDVSVLESNDPMNVKEISTEIKQKISKAFSDFPFSNFYTSRLGGDKNTAVLGKVSLDKKDEWANGIIENSRLVRFHIFPTMKNGKLHYTFEISSGHSLPKIRKSTVPLEKVDNSIEKLVSKLKDIDKETKVNETRLDELKVSREGIDIGDDVKIFKVDSDGNDVIYTLSFRSKMLKLPVNKMLPYAEKNRISPSELRVPDLRRFQSDSDGKINRLKNIMKASLGIKVPGLLL